MLESRAPLIVPGNGRPRGNVPAAVSDIGCERDINEDRYAVIDCPAGKTWLVCDGMGGTLGGDLAAQLAIDAVRRGLGARDYASPEEAIRNSVDEANRIIVLRRQNPAFSNMGTTIVAAIVRDRELVIAHAGDSRAYLVRNDAIEQLTVDHTYVQDLVERGTISQEEALSHPQAHVLTRCLGAEPRLKLDFQRYWIWDAAEGETEDKLLLCSDGLYSLVSDSEISKTASQNSPQETCIRLVELAKERGGYDNITLAVLPLGGQLREEKPPRLDALGGESALGRSALGRGLEFAGAKSDLSLSRQLVLLGVIGIIGAVVMTLFLLLRLGSA